MAYWNVVSVIVGPSQILYIWIPFCVIITYKKKSGQITS